MFQLVWLKHPRQLKLTQGKENGKVNSFFLSYFEEKSSYNECPIFKLLCLGKIIQFEDNQGDKARQACGTVGEMLLGPPASHGRMLVLESNFCPGSSFLLPCALGHSCNTLDPQVLATQVAKLPHGILAPGFGSGPTPVVAHLWEETQWNRSLFLFQIIFS